MYRKWQVFQVGTAGGERKPCHSSVREWVFAVLRTAGSQIIFRNSNVSRTQCVKYSPVLTRRTFEHDSSVAGSLFHEITNDHWSLNIDIYIKKKKTITLKQFQNNIWLFPAIIYRCKSRQIKSVTQSNPGNFFDRLSPAMKIKPTIENGELKRITSARSYSD